MKKNILLVEYAISTIDTIKELLPPPLFEITVVDEGDVAKELLSQNQYDMMITAAMLPKFHGFNLSQHAATNYHNLKIIIISEIYKGMNYKHQAITQYKADDFFEKPLDIAAFKARAFELLNVDEKNPAAGRTSSTAEVPQADTAKLPILQKLEGDDEDDVHQLSSEELFGDIIDEVQEDPPHEIKLDGQLEKPGEKKKEEISVTQQMPGIAQPITQPLTQPLTQPIPSREKPQMPKPRKEPEDLVATQLLPDLEKLKQTTKSTSPPAATRKIDLDLDDLMKPAKKEEKAPGEKKFKKIEDDISKRFEETLSGLGIKKKAARPPAPPPVQPTAPPAPPVTPAPAKPIVQPPPHASSPPTTSPTTTPPPTAHTQPTSPTPPAPPSTKPTPQPSPPPPNPPSPSSLPPAVSPSVPSKDTKPMKTGDALVQKTGEPEKKSDDVGGYDILGLIARGGMAEIYKAKKKGVKGFEKIIALKKILAGYGKDDKYIEMFVDEAKIAAELTHPNIVQIYDLGKKDDYYFIAMEYVAGRDSRLILRKQAETGIRFPEELSIYLILKVLEALNYAHSAKNSAGKRLDIVHRDISPPNILVSFSGEIKLTDFGVSKASIKMHHTVAGALKGKLLYMSPEQAKADKDVDFRSDLYSAGIILFELLTGEKLFMAHSEMAVLQKVQTGEIAKPSEYNEDIHPRLEAVVLKMLEKDKEKRYQRASDVINDLQKYLSAHYDHMPTPTHLSHALYALFKTEIEQEDTKIDLKPLPYVIKKIEKGSAEPEIEPDTLVETLSGPGKDIISETDIQVEDEIAPGVDEIMKEEAEREEFHPLVEIDLDDFQDEEPAVHEAQAPPVEHKKTPEPIESDAGLKPIHSAFQIDTPGEEEFKKKKKYLFIALAVILILAAIIAIYLITASDSGPLPPVEKKVPKSLGLMTKPPVTESETSGDGTPTGQPTGETDMTVQGTSPSGDIAETPKEKPTPEPKTKEAAQLQVPATGTVEKKPTPTQVKPQTNTGKPLAPVTKETPEKEGEGEVTKEGEEAAPDAEQQKLAEQARLELLKQKQLEEQKLKEAEQKRQEALMQAKEGDTVSINQVDTPPVPISQSPIELTRRHTRSLKASETILVTYLIDHKGNIETVRIVKKSSVKKINALIEKTIGRWKFKPAVKNNVNVKVWKTIPLTIKK